MNREVFLLTDFTYRIRDQQFTAEKGEKVVIASDAGTKNTVCDFSFCATYTYYYATRAKRQMTSVGPGTTLDG